MVPEMLAYHEENRAIKKQIKSAGRNYRLDIPTLFMKGFGWSDDFVKLIPRPEVNEIIIKNDRKPVGWMQFCLNINEAKWMRSPKKYKKMINESLGVDGREALHGTNWEEVEDGGYHNVKLGLDYIKSLSAEIKKSPEELMQPLKNVRNAHINYIKNLNKYLEENGGKKPKWMAKVEKELRNLK